MARKCPNCFAAVPATKVLVYTNDLVCPSCNSPLQVSALSRNISMLAALIVAAIIWRIASAYYLEHPGALGWVLPVLFAFLAYSVAAPLVLAFIADLQLKPLEPATVVAETAPAHQHHHSH
ncbi:MAG TPA: hypothetical protein VJW93_05740 [Candidatus Acidoferrales bacterium]|nr:hypothetical protein [Candidatus Acidoferrales bacterium]